MTERRQALLVAHGALVFLLGLAAGFPFAFEILGRFELWPLPSVPLDVPGDTRGWRMAHLEGVLNGLLLISVGAFGDRLRLSPRGAAVVFWGLLACAWGNISASWIAPLAEVRGLAFAGGVWNRLVFALFMIAIVGVVAELVGVLRGALSAARDRAD
jgi:hypothetical protein